VRAALDRPRSVGLSWHHQAIDRVADGLVVTARADDGTIEAVELEGPAWIVGVQWHPEDTAGTDPVQQRLFDVFVGRAAGRADRIPA
jgi:putative glutamine amidotransferase